MVPIDPGVCGGQGISSRVRVYGFEDAVVSGRRILFSVLRSLVSPFTVAMAIGLSRAQSSRRSSDQVDSPCSFVVLSSFSSYPAVINET